MKVIVFILAFGILYFLISCLTMAVEYGVGRMFDDNDFWPKSEDEKLAWWGVRWPAYWTIFIFLFPYKLLVWMAKDIDGKKTNEKKKEKAKDNRIPKKEMI